MQTGVDRVYRFFLVDKGQGMLKARSRKVGPVEGRVTEKTYIEYRRDGRLSANRLFKQERNTSCGVRDDYDYGSHLVLLP